MFFILVWVHIFELRVPKIDLIYEFSCVKLLLLFHIYCVCATFIYVSFDLKLKGTWVSYEFLWVLNDRVPHL